MKFWWAKQNQTYRHEIQGGYLWSPKRKANKARNPFYESMREVFIGDLILSFKDTRFFVIFNVSKRRKSLSVYRGFMKQGFSYWTNNN
jgi:hypothetical protein